MPYLGKTLVAFDINRINILPKESQSRRGLPFSFPLNVTTSEIQIITARVLPTAHKKRKKDKAWTETDIKN
jgi:hypothetical protein